MTATPPIDQLTREIKQGSREALGRAITLVESLKVEHRQRAATLLEALWGSTGKSLRIAISGIPGAGKSTLIDSLGMAFIRQGHRVAVLAIDPSSVRTGGSILGDKTRMGRLSAEENGFIRPSPNSGNVGGVARHTREAMLLCEAAGYDIILIETVGVGQSEVSAANMSDIFLLVTLSGGGDELQGIKRGILEIADIVVVNKADGDNKKAAEMAAAALRQSLQILSQNSESPPPSVFPVSSLSENGPEQLALILSEMDRKRQQDGSRDERRRHQRLRWLEEEIERQSVSVIRSHNIFQEKVQSVRESVLNGTQIPTLGALSLVTSCLLPNAGQTHET